MEIKIIQNGKEKKFKLQEMKGSISRKLLVLRDKLIKSEEKNDFSVELLDEITGFIVSSFGNNFTEDELLDSMDLFDINMLVLEIQKEFNHKSELKMKKIQEMASIL